VTTLLATEAALASGESFGNVSVADGGALQADPVRGKVTLHATIGQHRGNGAFRPGDSPPLPIQCDEGDQDVTINRSPVSINNYTTISIAIERDAEVGAVRAYLLAECGGIGRANAIIDNPVSHRKRQNRRTGGGECRDGEWRSCTMRRINHHAQGAGTHGACQLRQRSRISLSIRLGLGSVSGRCGYNLQTSRQSPFDSCFKCSLLGIRDLASVTSEHFQAVVLHRVMRSGDDHAASGAWLTRNE
jgi:hypothetical protein